MYKCIHFKIQELVDKETYEAYGDLCWSFMDDRLPIVIDHLRDELGPITINNWHIGGGYSLSGLRPPETTTGAKMSQHKFGRAVDCKFSRHSAEDVRQWLRQHWTVKYVQYHFGMSIPLTIEEKTSWLHLDVRNNEKLLNFFNP